MAFFEECGKILNNMVGEKILRNQNLCKLLYYYPKEFTYDYDPLQEPDIQNTGDLLLTHVYPMPKLPNAETEQKCYMTVTLTAGDKSYTDTNVGYRRLYLVFNIISHLSAWIISDSYRVYDIASEIDKILNNQITDLPIFSSVSYVDFDVKDYSNYFYGLQLVYGFSVNSNIECGALPQNLNVNPEIDTSIRPSFLPRNLGGAAK